jgi:hypothetical protein
MNHLAQRNVREIREGLLEAISHWGWQEKIRHDPELQADFVSTTYLKHNEEFCYTFTVFEKSRKVGIHIISPFQIPKVRFAETLQVLNYFNSHSTTGDYYLSGAGNLCYKWTISVFDASVGVETFKTLRDAGKNAFDEAYNSLLSVAFTNKAGAEIIQNHRLFWSKQKPACAKRA